MAKFKRVAWSEKFSALQAEAVTKGEKSDCAVKAIALVCGVSYAEAHATLKVLGRKDGHGTPNNIITMAVMKLGCGVRTWFQSEHRDVINAYPGVHKNLQAITTHHPRRFKKVWAEVGAGRRFLVFSDRHISAIIEGELHDWAVNNAKRVTAIVEVTRFKA